MENKTTIYLVRHAHSVYSTDELGRPLSAKGFADANQVARRMQTESVDVVVSSPYKRAIQTVEGIAEHFQVEIECIEEFKERVLAEGPVIEFDQAIEKVWKEASFAWEGGESNLLAQKRGIHALFHLLKRYENKHIVIGTHGNIMVLIMNYFSKKYDYNFWKNLKMPDIYKLTFEGNHLIHVHRIWEE